MLCAAWVLRLWRADLTVPLRYAPVDDTKFYLMLVKGIIEHGWYMSNSSLGAPFGQHLYDYPQGADNLNLLIIRGAGGVLVRSGAGGQPVPARHVRTSDAPAIWSCGLWDGRAGRGVSSVLFSLLAYHFFRGNRTCCFRPITRCR